MATVEANQQYQIFTGELVDNRTPTQKKRDARRDKLAKQPHQTLMFSTQETVQFGVKANPLLPLSPHMKLPMMLYDPRTEDEIEADRMREAQRLTTPLFPVDEETTPIPEPVSAAISPEPVPVVQPQTIHERRRPMPPAPPGQFAVQHRFAPDSDVPKREKVVWRPTSKPATRPIGLAEVGDPDPKNEGYCHVAEATEAFEDSMNDQSSV